jgi:hypothetical protein
MTRQEKRERPPPELGREHVTQLSPNRTGITACWQKWVRG